jgi:glycosyltransferase involved in cell wall biosynthesis
VENKHKQSIENDYSVTLCICTMNRPDELDRCLKSVFQSSERPNEIIVSDDSPDGTYNKLIVAKYPDVVYQEGPHRGLGPNRNACIRRAKSNYIIFIDDDVRVSQDFFAISCRLISSSDLKTIITGHEKNYGGASSWQGEMKKIVPHNPDFWGFQKIPVSKDYGAIVINSTIFPSILFKQALFDENLRYGSEEIDMAQHAISLGFRIVYEDCLYVEHYPSPVNRDHYKQFINASRLYATAKAYWRYNHSPIKTIIYVVLAPLHLIGSAIRRGKPLEVGSAIQATLLAGRYFITR